MAVAGLDPLAVVELDQIAIAARTLSAIDHTIGSRVDRRTDRPGDIDTGMHCRGPAERIGTDAVIAGERQMLDRLRRRDRDDAMLQRIQLLPRHEQRAKLGVGAQIGLCRRAIRRFERAAHGGLARHQAFRCQTKAADMRDGADKTLFGNTLRARSDRNLLLLDLLERCDDISGQRVGLGIDRRRWLRQRGDITLAGNDRNQQRLALFDALGMRLRCGLDRGDVGLHLADADLHLGDLGFGRQRCTDDARHRDRTNGGLRHAIGREAQRNAGNPRHRGLRTRAEAEALQVAPIMKDKVAGLEIGLEARHQPHARRNRN